jgi:hypothetical protein
MPRGADEDRVADRLVGELDSAAHQVVEAQRVVRDAQAHGERFAGGSARNGFSVRDGAAASGIDLRPVRRGGFITFRLQLLRGAEATVGFAFGEQAVCVLAIDPEGAPTAGTARVGLRLPGPSSQSRPSHNKSSMSWVSWRISLRSRSVSSMRSRKAPPVCRAKSQL